VDLIIFCVKIFFDIVYPDFFASELFRLLNGLFDLGVMFDGCIGVRCCYYRLYYEYINRNLSINLYEQAILLAMWAVWGVAGSDSLVWNRPLYNSLVRYER
jgi:hypothetical protein